MRRSHAQKMLAAGKFRVGTLYEYRKSEDYTFKTLDREEGVLRHTEIVKQGNASQITRYSGGHIEGTPAQLAATQLKNVFFQNAISEDDQYIYCTSLSPSWDGDVDPAYDVCIEITHVAAFSWLMVSTLRARKLASDFQMNQVEYGGRDRVTLTDSGMHSGGPEVRPALLKPPSFAKQQEYRAMFRPTTNGIQAVIARDPSLKKLVRRHSVRPI
jgi:hypothetical protein